MALFSKKNTPQPRRRQSDAPQRQPTSAADLDDRYLFRRNRTLTGSVSPHIVSATEQTADMQSPRVQTHHLVRKRRHVGLLFFSALLVSGILVLLLQQFTATVALTSNTPTPIDVKPYENRIQTYLNERPIERLRFLLNTEQLAGYLQAELPEVLAVRAEQAVGFGKSNLHITMRKPVVSWELPATGRHYVDTNGMTFTHNYFSAPEVEVLDQSGAQIEAGQTIASTRFLSFVGRLVGAMHAQDATITQLILPPGTTRQIEMRLKDVAFPVKVSIDRPVGEQAEDATRAVQWLKGRGLQPLYLDIRIGGKAYYKE
jgi:hypothetical protein